MSERHPSAMREVPGCKPPEPAASAARRRALTRGELVNGILAGDRIVLARAITLVESLKPSDRSLAEEVIEACLPHSGRSIRVGITGVPGAGKSSLIETLGVSLIQKHGEKIAVLAVDPSSQISGGSILGDKTRMTALAASDRAFIRPSPSRGTFGGIAQRTREAMLLCEAAGYGVILVETVGVGQSETAVHGMVDFFVLVLLTGAGDELQGIKRGVMEMADLVAINKADGDNAAAAARTRGEAENALHFFPAKGSGWTPRAIACSAATGIGIDLLWECVRKHRTMAEQNGWLERARRAQAQQWMQELIALGLRQRFESHPAIRARMTALLQDVGEGRVTSFRAARELLDILN